MVMYRLPLLAAKVHCHGPMDDCFIASKTRRLSLSPPYLLPRQGLYSQLVQANLLVLTVEFLGPTVKIYPGDVVVYSRVTKGEDECRYQSVRTLDQVLRDGSQWHRQVA